MTERRRLLDRLPAASRRRSGDVLRRWLAAADDLLDGLETRSRPAVDRLVERVAELRPPGARLPGSAVLPGGPEAVAEWFAERHVTPPVIWPALEVERAGRGRLRALRAWRRAAVFAWVGQEALEQAEDGSLAEVAALWGAPRQPGDGPGTEAGGAGPDARSAERLLPAGCRVAGVVLERWPRPAPPLPGGTVPGRLLFRASAAAGAGEVP